MAHTPDIHFTLRPEPEERRLGNTCTVHGHHYPTPLRTVVHHIWPREYGGPDVEANRVWLCDNGHYNVHTLLDMLRKGQALPRGMGTRNERRIARLGWDRIQRGAL